LKKIRPLPELDLARIAPLTNEQKLNALRQLKQGHPPYSYQPARKSQLDILNVEAGPLGIVPRARWAQIAEQILRRSRNDPEAQANLAFASALYNFADSERIAGITHEFFPLPIGITHKVSYWLPAVLSVNGTPTAFFIDPRRAKKLTADGRRFVFSMMHERIRVSDPDFAEIELGIIQFGVDGKIRVPKLFVASDVKLFDFHELDDMVRETYKLWQMVLEEREAEIRRRASGDDWWG